MKWIIGLVVLFWAAGASAICPSSYNQECGFGTKCREAIDACEQAERETYKLKNELEELRGALRLCLRSGDTDSLQCSRAKRR